MIKKNIQDNTLTLINISKVSGKPNCFTYNFNVLIRKFNPLFPILSFAKINDNDIFKRYNNFVLHNKIELISFTKDEFLETN